MQSGRDRSAEQADGLCAAKVFYFCYCLLDGDRVGAEEAARGTLARFRARSGEGRAAGRDKVHLASLALAACAAAGPVQLEKAERLLFRVFRLSGAEIARMIGRGAGEVAHAGQTRNRAGEEGIPLLPLLEGECMAVWPQK